MITSYVSVKFSSAFVLLDSCIYFAKDSWFPMLHPDQRGLLLSQLLMTRLRILQGPGYPYEQVLAQYHNQTNLVMCAYLPEFKTFNRTKGLLSLSPACSLYCSILSGFSVDEICT